MRAVVLACGDVVSAALTLIEMALRQRGPTCAWVQADPGALVGVDDGRAFAVAIDPGIGITPAQRELLGRWRRAGASVGSAGTIREALAIVGGGRAG